MSERSGQLGPLVSRAFVQAMEKVTGQIMVDNDVLMRALRPGREGPDIVTWESHADSDP